MILAHVLGHLVFIFAEDSFVQSYNLMLVTVVVVVMLV